MPSQARFKRIMLKVGGESLIGNRDYGIDPQAALDVAKQIKNIHEHDVQVAVVIGGGNIFRGIAGSKNGIDRATADYMGMLATVMNALALQDALEKVGVPTRVQTALQMPAVAESFVRRRAIRHMEKGRVVILAAGTGVPYVTTDTGASLHALELHCDVLMKATKVNGIYDKDPMKYPDAKRFKTLSFKDAIEMPGVEVMDTAALAMSKENDMAVMVFELFEANNLADAVMGKDVGTYVSNDVKPNLRKLLQGITETPLPMRVVSQPQGVTMKNFGINGFGRIGRTAFRVWWHKHTDELDLKVINTSGSMDLSSWVHLLKYDSNYGIFDADLSYHQQQTTKEVSDENPVLGVLIIRDGVRGERQIIVTAQRDPVKIPWGHYGVETVIESTGVFISQEKASLHLQGGAQKVIISAPPKGSNVPTGIIGVNHFEADQHVVSNASCTTNCVAPVVAIMHQDIFGVKKAMMTTIHSYTDDQNLHDNSHKDLRRARAAALNIVPTSTGAAISVTEIIPELKGSFDGLAVRVPTPVGSLSDMVFVTSRPTTKEEVNHALIEASQQDQWRGILAVSDEPLVSSDIRGRAESSIVDLSLTNVVDGDLVKVVSWYDNEFGYCNRLVEQVVRV